MADPTRAQPGEDPDHDLDAQWADLTARLGELQLPEADETDEPAPAAESYLPRPLGPRDYEPDDDEADLVDGFVPPEPQPLHGARPALVLGWAVLLAGLGVLLISVIAWRSAPGIVLLAAGGCVLAGTALLLWQLPSHRQEDGDDGAVV